MTDDLTMIETPRKTTMPKRLILLLILYVAASISGILAKQGVLFCILTLMMVLAIIGRQKTALYMLRGYTLVQLALMSILPVVMYDPDNLVAGPTTVSIGELHAKLPDYVIFTFLIALSILQVWIASSAKVQPWFTAKVNMNIMS